VYVYIILVYISFYILAYVQHNGMSHLKKLFTNWVTYTFRAAVTYKEFYNRVYVYD
jgi:hypothetical protein